MSLVTPDEARILEFLDEDGAFTTHKIAVHLYGNANLRHDSARVSRICKSLAQRHFIRTLDALKPVCWCRTPNGSAILRRHSA